MNLMSHTMKKIKKLNSETNFILKQSVLKLIKNGAKQI